MVQIIQEGPRKQSFAQKLNIGVGRGLEAAQKLYSEYEKKEAIKQENEAAKRLGIDLSGIQDPKMRQEALAYALQGINQQNLEQTRQQGKTNLLNEKQGFLGKLFGGGPPGQRQSMTAMEAQEGANSQTEQEGGQFDPSQITDAQILQLSALDPVLGREARMAKDAAVRDKRDREKQKLAEKKASPEFQREQHLQSSQAQADVKYNQQIQENAKQLELKEKSLDNLERLNKKGVTGKAWEKAAEKFGLINITSEGRREFASEQKNLITDIRSILGSQFSQFEFQTILNAYPSPDFSQEANAAIIKNQKEFVNIKKKEKEFADQLKKQNGGKLPFDYQAQVNEMVHEYASSRLPEIKANTRKILNEEYGIPKGHTLMFDMNEEPLSVPDSEIERYIDLGATLP